MNVYIPGTGLATQGPCDSGFHVPLKSEWTGLISIMVGLGYPNSNGDNWKSLLHLPYAGMRAYTNEIGSQGTYGSYWASTPAGSSYTTRADRLQIGSSIVSDAMSFRGNANSIRAFKDEFVVPTSGWTVIAGTLGSGGIFWNTTDGIISITSDGSTGYTIRDKNEGATVVYNSGDTLSQNNCGEYYQFGNNYGFAWTGSVTTSSTQVNASSYGPGNYYSSSTFITGNQDWSSSQNDNLWGGVSGNIKVMSELKNAYIGEYIIKKSIDVRGKTLAQIQAEGWGFNNGVGSYTLDSNGISVSTNNAWANLYYNLSLSNAHKITLRYTGYAGYGGGSSYGGGAFLGIAPSYTTPGTSNMPGYLFGIYQSGSNSGGKGTNIRLNWDNILSTSLSNNVAGNIDETFVINLDTGVCTYTITSPVSGTTSATLTSSQLAQIKQYGWICFFLQEWTGGYVLRLHTAEFKIE